MSKRKKIAILLLLLAGVNVAFIWGNSLLPREVSSALSKMVGTILDWFMPGSATTSQGEGQGILRKIAHFTEFCSLGFLLCTITFLLQSQKWIPCAIPCGIGVAVAVIDETIQMFVPGRGPQLRDVGIDSLGVVLGIAFAFLLAWLWRKKCKGQEKHSPL